MLTEGPKASARWLALAGAGTAAGRSCGFGSVRGTHLGTAGLVVSALMAATCALKGLITSWNIVPDVPAAAWFLNHLHNEGHIQASCTH